MKDFMEVLKIWNNGIERGAQARLAKALNESTGNVSSWLSGRLNPSEKNLKKMSDLFHKSKELRQAQIDCSIEGLREFFHLPEPNMKVKRYAFVSETQLVPILGVSAASRMMFILQEQTGYLTTKKESPDDFAIEVIDHCMEDPGDPRNSIYQGDAIIVRPNVPVKDGDVVVACVGEESTIKRIYYNKKDGTVDLVPDNPKYKPLHFNQAEVKIIGKVIKRDNPVLAKKRREEK